MIRTVFTILLLDVCGFQLKAQVAMAEMDSLYGLWNANHIGSVDIIWQNLPDIGRVKQYKFRIPSHIIIPDSILKAKGIGDGNRQLTYDELKLDWYRRLHIVDMQSIATVEALMDKAKEKDKWTNCGNDADTMMYSLVFANAESPIPLNDKMNTMVDAAEYLTFSHYSSKDKNGLVARNEGYLFYSCLLASMQQNRQHFDFEELLKQLSTILEQPDIERRSIYLSHSSDIWRHSAFMFYVDMDEEPCGKGETNGFVFTMPNDERANEVLAKMKMAIEDYTDTHFDMPYIYIPSERYGAQDARLFYATNAQFSQLDENTLKLDVRISDRGIQHMVLVAITQGDRLLPTEWAGYSRIVDGEFERMK
jgi:hypothetical protein